jgi:hypothetical protein
MDIVDQIIQNETDPHNPDAITNDLNDSGGLTRYGISIKAHPEAWKNGPPTLELAKEIYWNQYVKPFRGITDDLLLHQLVDWGVTAGQEIVIKHLQQILNVKVDGDIGPITLKAIEKFPAKLTFGVMLPGITRLNILVRDARVMFYATLAKRRPKDLKYLLGWIARAQEFI